MGLKLTKIRPVWLLALVASATGLLIYSLGDYNARSDVGNIAEINTKLKKPEQAVMSEKEFLNFLKTASDEMRKRNMVGKDIYFSEKSS